MIKETMMILCSNENKLRKDPLVCFEILLQRRKLYQHGLYREQQVSCISSSLIGVNHTNMVIYVDVSAANRLHWLIKFASSLIYLINYYPLYHKGFLI